ncbi:PREDICTED: pre-mRNA-splicing factor 38-like [Brassica oleracea var. oleracea]|uniref:Pre-mRNA-splicing factor 38 n=1 Tax=Brassica oleracea var. oleracea TaxID=109376 RepID=A0A0D3C5H0_BRAOL|nr:PREDICTED: pre-mRNA-splicing factor 38-like [Brassica oleracea var. oleracea]
MANRTDPLAKNIRGTNPQNLVEKIVRTKIQNHTFWKEQCFGLTAETLVDKAMELDHVGGTFGGNRKPTPFLCLVLKMLQIQPEKEIVVEFIKNDDYKYVRVLGAFYLRLTGSDVDVYRYLEPLYNDYRKVRQKLADGRFSLTHVDEVIEELLTKDYSCDIAMPRLKKRCTLEQNGVLEPRKSVLEDDFEEEEEKEENEGMAGGSEDEKDDHRRSLERERERDRRRDSHRHRDRDYDRDYDMDRDYDRDRGRGRDRDRERDRGHYRDRDRERDRDHYREKDRRERARRRSKSRSRDRRRRDSDDDWDREEPKRKKEKKEKKMREDGTDHPDPEIAEANKLRASLGLKPLR